MIDGISIALPTYNRLEYLKKCLYSAKKYSVLPETEVSLFVDGSSDGTFEWLNEQEIPYIGRRQNKGVFSAWNKAIENCKNNYVFLGEDDLFFGPEWDLKLAEWIEELQGEYVLCPQLIEPLPNSAYHLYNYGINLEGFDEEKFVQQCMKIRRHEALAATGLWCMRKDLFLSIGGFDVNYDPVLHGGRDLDYRFAKKHPQMNWIRVLDCLMYHFPPKLPKRQHGRTREEYKEIHERNMRYFQEKNGVTFAEAYETIPKGLRR